MFWVSAMVRLAAVLVAVMMVSTACSVPTTGAPRASSSPTAPATTTASPTPLPTATPVPTPPPPAELVLRIVDHFNADHWTMTSLVADGRLISRAETGWQVQVLSPAGIAQVREAVRTTGLFAESVEVPLVMTAEANPPFNCDTSGIYAGTMLQLQSGPELVSVDVWHEPDGLEPWCFVPSAERDALDALLARLSSLEEWLPADGWVERAPRPYEAERYRMLAATAPWDPGWGELYGDQPDLGDLAWPLAGTPTTFGSARPQEEPDRPSWRCEVVTADAATLVEDAIVDAGAVLTDIDNPVAPYFPTRGYAVGALFHDVAGEGAVVAMILEVMRPDEAGCADMDPDILNCWQIAGVQPLECATF